MILCNPSLCCNPTDYLLTSFVFMYVYNYYIVSRIELIHPRIFMEIDLRVNTSFSWDCQYTSWSTVLLTAGVR